MRVLIIRPAALGDTLMLMPALVQMRFTGEIILVGRLPGLDYLRPYVHACLDYEAHGWHRLFLDSPPNGPGLLAAPSVDRVAGFLQDPQGLVKNNFEIFLPDVPIYLFPPFPPEGEKVHVAFYLSQCLHSAGCDIDPSKSLEGACRRPLFRDEASPTPRKGIVFHPGSGRKKKNYPPDFWVALITALRESRFSQNETLSVLLGPAEELLHSFYPESLEGKRVEVIFFPEREELLSIMKKAALYIGHDSGVTHLAAMCGTPTIALFRGTPVFQWRPLGPEVRVIENKESGPNLVAQVLEAADELFGKTTKHD